MLISSISRKKHKFGFFYFFHSSQTWTNWSLLQDLVKKKEFAGDDCHSCGIRSSHL